MRDGFYGNAIAAKREAYVFTEDANGAGSITYKDHARDTKAAERAEPMHGMTQQLKVIQGGAAAEHLFRREIIQRPIWQHECRLAS
jgi:hypothetical protein